MASEELLDAYLAEIEALKGTLDDALNARRLAASTVDTVVELILLRSYSVTERFFRDLFYACAMGDSAIPGSGGIVEVADSTQVDLLLLSTLERQLPYVSWLPAERTLEAAKRYLTEANPFERLRYRDVELRTLQELAVVRNAVAHPDSEAMEKFKKLTQESGYPHARPAQYLKSRRAGDMEIYITLARLESIAHGITDSSTLEGSQHLSTERDFSSGSRSPAGSYSCTKCEAAIEFAGGKLPVCSECPAPVRCGSCGHRRKASSLWRRRVGGGEPG